MNGNFLLYSSGVDSYIAYYYLRAKGINVIPVYINMNHKYYKFELSYIRKSRPDTVILNIPEYHVYEEYDAFIPVRNLIFCCMLSAHFCNAYENITIYLGGLKDDRISDNSKIAFEKFSEVLSISLEKPVQVLSAFDFKLTKYEIVQWFRTTFPENEHDLIDNTFSCYHPIENKQDPHCYSCRACFRRNVSLMDIEVLPFDQHVVETYYKEFKNNKEAFDPIRYEQTIKYCNKIRGVSNE